MKCVSLLNCFNLHIGSNKSTAASYDKHYFIILYSLHRWSFRCRQKANQFLHCELFSSYCFSVSAFEFLTETDGRTCRDLHKTRMSLLSGKSLFLNRVCIWKAPAACQRKILFLWNKYKQLPIFNNIQARIRELKIFYSKSSDNFFETGAFNYNLCFLSQCVKYVFK